jgi:hypothetical protein
MALALNTFKTVTEVVTDTSAVIYTAPAGVSSIILMAQITNVTTTSGSVTFSHDDGVKVTELIKDYEIPGKDAASALTGKLVLETGHKLRIFSNENDKFKVTLSILESANE